MYDLLNISPLFYHGDVVAEIAVCLALSASTLNRNEAETLSKDDLFHC
jgi:hypothetical protein